MNKRIPSLDGFRALGIAAVIVMHVAQRYAWPYPGSLAHKILVGRGDGEWMGDGVGIFFVLSGYLITTLLLREYEGTRRIAIGTFYARRAFRILPPLLAYLLFALGFCLYRRVPFQANDFASAIFFYRDYFVGQNLWITQHTWSLSVEEQFYLLWPVVLVLFLRYGNRSTAAKGAAVLVLCSPFFRMSGRLLHISAFSHLEYFMLHCRMDALMCGCFVALCAGLPKFEAMYAKVAKVWWLLPLEFWGVSLALENVIGINYRKSIGLTIDSIAMALFVLWATRNSKHVVGRVLNSRLFVTAGVLSYSAYLWQTFFLHRANTSMLARMPGCLVLIWIAAWCSYNFVEQPFLRLRGVLMKRPLRKHANPDSNRPGQDPSHPVQDPNPAKHNAVALAPAGGLVEAK